MKYIAAIITLLGLNIITVIALLYFSSISKNIEISPLTIKSGWLELDTIKDLNNYINNVFIISKSTLWLTGYL